MSNRNYETQPKENLSIVQPEAPASLPTVITVDSAYMLAERDGAGQADYGQHRQPLQRRELLSPHRSRRSRGIQKNRSSVHHALASEADRG